MKNIIYIKKYIFISKNIRKYRKISPNRHSLLVPPKILNVISTLQILFIKSPQ